MLHMSIDEYGTTSALASVGSPDDNMSEVERRLEEALLFKDALKLEFFPKDDRLLAQEVELKIKNLIRDELQILMGMKRAKEEGALENEELNALKQIAKRLVEKTAAVSSTNDATSPAPAPPLETTKSKEVSVTLPNGTIVKTHVNAPVLPENYQKQSFQDIADQAAQSAQFQALNFTPKSGLLGVAISMANQGLIAENSVEYEDEAEDR
jgi:hypothetical protein